MVNWTIIFSTSHPFLFTLMVLALIFAMVMFIVIAGWVAVQPIHYFFRFLNRRQRSANVREKGWPPQHLDADGDFKGDD